MGYQKEPLQIYNIWLQQREAFATKFNYVEKKITLATPYLPGIFSYQLHHFFSKLFNNDSLILQHILFFTGKAQVSIKMIFDDKKFNTVEESKVEYFKNRLFQMSFNYINTYGVVYFDQHAYNITTAHSEPWDKAVKAMTKYNKPPNVLSLQLYDVTGNRDINLNDLNEWLNKPLSELEQQLSAFDSRPPKGVEKHQCISCCNAENVFAVNPCGHVVFCQDCLEVYRATVKNCGRQLNCPICTGPVTMFERWNAFTGEKLYWQ